MFGQSDNHFNFLKRIELRALQIIRSLGLKSRADATLRSAHVCGNYF